MGPLCCLKQFQNTIQVNSPTLVSSDKSESIFIPVTGKRDCGSSPETGSGKGTRSGNSRLLFPAISCTKKEWKITSGVTVYLVPRGILSPSGLFCSQGQDTTATVSCPRGQDTVATVFCSSSYFLYLF